MQMASATELSERENAGKGEGDQHKTESANEDEGKKNVNVVEEGEAAETSRRKKTTEN